jgi:hypothetical protein
MLKPTYNQTDIPFSTRSARTRAAPPAGVPKKFL